MWKKLLTQFDWLLFGAVVALVLLGVMIIYSTGIINEGGPAYAGRQLLFAGVGIPLLLLVSLINYEILRRWVWVLYMAICSVLVAVLFFGKLVRGTRSWFEIGGFSLQPSEFAKVVIIIVLAQYFSVYAKEMYRFRHIVVSGVLTLIPIALVVIQPDLGSALIIAAIWGGMLLVAGIKKTHLAVLGASGFALAAIAWLVFLRPYQKDRIMTFLRPQDDPLGQGYNVIQSTIAVGSGGWFGKGLGHGSQSQLNFLPEQHTDFVFAVLAEELGFVGAAALLGLFGFVLWRISRSAQLARSNFGFFIGIGVLVMLVAQILINVGMNMGIMPVAGIPLPLVSYGGSSMIASLIALGLVESVAIRRAQRLSGHAS